jgi:hypothetical protein
VHETYKLNRSHSPLAEFVIAPLLELWVRRHARSSACARQRSALVPEAAVFRLGRRLGFVFVLLRSPTRNGVIGARPQIDEYVIEIAFGLVPNDGMTLSCAVLTFLRPLTTTLAESA